MLERLAAALKNAVTRGKVVQSRVGPRTLLQITGLDGVVQQTIELLLPPGYSARPAADADVALLQVMGTGDHIVAVGGDLAGTAIADLAENEYGLSNGTHMIIVRNDHLELVSPTYILATTPQFRCTGEFIQGYGTGNTTTLGTHTHPPGVGGNTAAPNPNT